MTERRSAGELPAPVVSPQAYDTNYYLAGCAGHQEWNSSHGKKAAGIYRWALGHSGFVAGETMLDVGTGRAEMIALAAEQGARLAIGLEYSPDAVTLARRTLAARGVESTAHVMLGDARRLPLADGSLDLVTMLDVVEHLAAPELDECLREVARCLRPTGRLMVHTFPTSTIYNVTYRLQRNLLPWRLRSWPRNPRNDLEVAMHVNEQTPRRLAAALRRAGLRPETLTLGNWVYADHVPEPSRETYHRLSRHRITKALGVADLWALARPML
jgi:ubiquinone/menaquinone biosynthesis C-methylase UbiE